MVVTLNSIRIWWYDFNQDEQRKGYKKMLLILTSILLIASLLFGMWTPISIIAYILLLVACRWHMEDWAVYALIASFVCYALTNGIALILLTIVLVYLFYQVVEGHRVKRLTKISEATPSKLSGVKYKDPQVEIIIRGDRK